MSPIILPVTRSLSTHKSPDEEKGLNGGNFDKVARYLGATLDELSVPNDIAMEVMTLVSGTRDDVSNL